MKRDNEYDGEVADFSQMLDGMKEIRRFPLKQKDEKTCTWRNVSGNYFPGCRKDGNVGFIYGERIAESFTFCPHCGRRIEK